MDLLEEKKNKKTNEVNYGKIEGILQHLNLNQIYKGKRMFLCLVRL